MNHHPEAPQPVTATPPKPLGTVAIIGVGMIGGSIGKRLRAVGACGEVIGADKGPLNDALAVGAIDRELPLTEAAAAADLIILSTPVGAMEKLATEIAPHLKATATITDTGSVKAHVGQRLTPILGPRFVAGHPIAGKEHPGVCAADAELYVGAAAILTPDDTAADDAISRVIDLWHWLGSHVTTMTPEMHDRVFAAVSHLPHLAAFALLETVAATRTEHLDPAAFAAGGLRDFTRVAAADAVMWRDICLTNRDAVIEMLHAYELAIGGLRESVENGDGARMLQIFSAARKVRERMNP